MRSETHRFAFGKPKKEEGCGAFGLGVVLRCTRMNRKRSI